MKHSSIFQTVYGQPWQCTREAWHDLHQMVLANFQAGGKRETLDPQQQNRPERDANGDVVRMIELVGDVAVIPVSGMLVKGATASDKKYYGWTSYEDITEEINLALESGAKGIGLVFDSPGGTVTGSDEAADKIADLSKSGIPTYAYTEDMMASAAYKMAVGTLGIFSTPSAIVGSIGTLWETVSVAKALEAMGIDWRVFASGKFKGMGHMATRLTDDQAEFMQAEVDRLSDEFKAFVNTYRAIPDEEMQGQFHDGKMALRVGMVDRLMRDEDEFVAYIQSQT